MRAYGSEQCARVMQWMQALAPDITTEERLVFAYTHSVQKETGLTPLNRNRFWFQFQFRFPTPTRKTVRGSVRVCITWCDHA
jgi:hypothetical protein